MGTFGKSLERELGKNTGKWVSNKIFGDSWSTPHKVIIEQRNRDHRKQERDSARAYKEKLQEAKMRDKQYKQREKEKEQWAKERYIESNKQEVENHTNYFSVIQSVHKDYSNPMDWNSILIQEPPQPVQPTSELTEYYKDYTSRQVDEKIQEEKSKFQPSFAYNFLKKYFSPQTPMYLKVILVLWCWPILILFYNRRKIDIEKINEVEKSVKGLEENRQIWFQEYISEHDKAYKQYIEEKVQYDKIMSLAIGIQKKDKQSFIYAINYFKPFEDLKEYGSDISFSFPKNNLEVTFFAREEKAIPHTTKRLLRNGNEIKEDPIPTSVFYEIYQDYVCSCILRIAKDTFGLLPIDKVIINAKQNKVNSTTGQYQDDIIISTLIERPKLDSLNFDLIDPSNSMKNFITEMNFKPDIGFCPVTPVIINNPDEPTELQPIIESALIKIWTNPKYQKFCTNNYLFPKSIENNAILFIGLNPTFPEADKNIQMYPITQRANKNPYFKKFEDISEFTKTKWAYLDLLFVRNANPNSIQEILHADYVFIWEQLVISKRILEACKPKAIVVCNSLAATFLGKDRKGKDNIWMEIVNENLGNRTWSNIPIFYTSQLSGQDALDDDSYESLKMQLNKVVNPEVKT